VDSASSEEAGKYGIDEVDDSSVWTFYLLTLYI
jgi:hypothetical protein